MRQSEAVLYLLLILALFGVAGSLDYADQQKAEAEKAVKAAQGYRHAMMVCNDRRKK